MIKGESLGDYRIGAGAEARKTSDVNEIDKWKKEVRTQIGEALRAHQKKLAAKNNNAGYILSTGDAIEALASATFLERRPKTSTQLRAMLMRFYSASFNEVLEAAELPHKKIRD